MFTLPLSSPPRLSLRKASAHTIFGIAALLPLCAIPAAHAQSWVLDPTQSTQTNNMSGSSCDTSTGTMVPFDNSGPGSGYAAEASFGLLDGHHAGATSTGFATSKVTQSLVYVWDPGSDDDGNQLTTPAPAKVYFRLFGEAEAGTDGHVQGTNAAALLAGAFSSSCAADDGLGDQAVVSGPSSVEWNDGWDANLSRRSKSSGTHLVQKDGSSGTITFTFNVSAHGEGSLTIPSPTTSNQAPPTMDGGGGIEAWPVTVTEDSRAVTISSSLGQTFHKSSTRFDSNGAALPDPDVPDSDGTVHANSVVPSTSTSNMDEGTDQYDILYHAGVSGAWAANSTYHWHLSLAGQPTQIQNSFPDGTFTLPGDPPLDYRGEYDQYKAPAGAQEHAYIHLTDAQDGADGTANYYVTFHEIVENLQDVGARIEINPASYGASDGSQPAGGFVNVRQHKGDQIDYSVGEHAGGGILTVGGAVIGLLFPETDPLVIAFLAGAGYTLGLATPPDDIIYPLQGTEGQFTSDVGTELQIAAGNTDGVFMPTTDRMRPAFARTVAALGNYDDYFTGRSGTSLEFSVQVYRRRWRQNKSGDGYGTHGYTGPILGSITTPGSIEYVYNWQ